MARSLNKVQLIGNLTRDPELRYTPSGAAVCSFGMATNRSWTTESGEKRDEAEFHNIVSWNKLAEICSQYLAKGRQVFIEGRIATRSWNAPDGTQKSRTEIVASDVILLGPRPATIEGTEPATTENTEESQEAQKDKKTSKKSPKDTSEEEVTEEVAPGDIPF